MLVATQTLQQKMARNELQDLWRLGASHKVASLRRT